MRAKVKLSILLCLAAFLKLAATQDTTNATNSSTTAIPTLKVCTKCRCYRVDCNRIDQPDIDCDNLYKDSCENPEDITQENDCNLQCDCCLEGACYHWTSYNCIIYRTYEITTVMYFIFFCIHYFVIWRLMKHFFRVRKNWEAKPKRKSILEKEGKKEEVKYFFKYQQFFWIDYHPENDKKNYDEVTLRRVKNLFEQISIEKWLARRNLIYFGGVVFWYVGISILNFYVILALPEKPFTFASIVWVQHSTILVLWGALVFGFYRFPTYQAVVVRNLIDFEREYDCKIRIVHKIGFIEFNFGTQKWAKSYNQTKLNRNDSSKYRQETTSLKGSKDSVTSFQSLKDKGRKSSEGKNLYKQTVNPKEDDDEIYRSGSDKEGGLLASGNSFQPISRGNSNTPQPSETRIGSNGLSSQSVSSKNSDGIGKLAGSSKLDLKSKRPKIRKNQVRPL